MTIAGYFDKSEKRGDEVRISKWTLTTWRRASTGMRCALLNPILGGLDREGRIRIVGEHGEE
jgi:hypothetical protein